MVNSENLAHRSCLSGNDLNAVKLKINSLGFPFSQHKNTYYLFFILGNVTPIPTTGELEELSSIEENTIVEELPVEDIEPENLRNPARFTPLKSLLKKQSVDMDSDSESDPEGGDVSPKKVHFSEIDQIKLMSQESLASMAASESGEILPVTLCKTVMTTTPSPSVPR